MYTSFLIAQTLIVFSAMLSFHEGNSAASIPLPPFANKWLSEITPTGSGVALLAVALLGLFKFGFLAALGLLLIPGIAVELMLLVGQRAHLPVAIAGTAHALGRGLAWPLGLVLMFFSS